MLASATKNLSVGGSIKVEMVFCAAWSVVWTRVYNNSGHAAWMATGIERIENGSIEKRYDYSNRSCGTFCIDSLASGRRSFGHQVYWPQGSANVSFVSTAYYCAANSPSACSSIDKVKVTGPAIESRIVRLANANTVPGPCGLNSLGSYGFTSPSGTSSCPHGRSGTFARGWSDEFASWVWANADSRIDLSGLPAGPGGFVSYSGYDILSLPQIAHVGDVAVMAYHANSIPVASHVGIVTEVDGSGGATIVAGDEGADGGSVGLSHYTAGDYERAPIDDDHFYVVGYVSPRLK